MFLRPLTLLAAALTIMSAAVTSQAQSSVNAPVADRWTVYLNSNGFVTAGISSGDADVELSCADGGAVAFTYSLPANKTDPELQNLDVTVMIKNGGSSQLMGYGPIRSVAQGAQSQFGFHTSRDNDLVGIISGARRTLEISLAKTGESETLLRNTIELSAIGSTAAMQELVQSCASLATLFTGTSSEQIEPGNFDEPAWNGYRTVASLAPGKLKSNALDMIIQIKSVINFEEDEDSIVILDTDEQKPVTREAALNEDRRALQIETCRNQGLKRCPIFTGHIDATGVINNGSELYTCRHVIHNWIAVAAKANSLSVDKISPPMILLDHNGNMLFNSAYRSEGSISISAINTDPRLLGIRSEHADPQNNKLDFLNEISEFVALKIPTNIIDKPPVSISPYVEDGERLYNVGYPIKTNRFGGVEKGDAPGDQLVISSGTVVASSSLQAVVLSTALATGGISGGAMLKENGDLAGLVCSDVTEPVLGESSRGVLLDFDAHENIWRHGKVEPL